VQDNTGAERTGSYGGGSESPIIHQLAFFRFGRELAEQSTAAIGQHQPRALAWDQPHDALYVAGLGSDSILQIRHASQASIAVGATAGLSSTDNCGPDGLAVTASGTVLAWCSFTRSVSRIEFTDQTGDRLPVATVTTGHPLIASAMTTKQHQGLVLFHVASNSVSQQGNLACASCHPPTTAPTACRGGSTSTSCRRRSWPAASWALTPTSGMAAMRHSATACGRRCSVSAAMALAAAIPTRSRRISRRYPRFARRPAIPPRSPAASSCSTARAVDRATTGRANTDRQRHKLTGTLRESDTPSLLGVAASAPYFHDGSAATLESLLRDRGAVHGMADTARLGDREVADLTAFLDTL